MEALAESNRKDNQDTNALLFRKSGASGSHRFRLDGTMSPEWAVSLHNAGNRLCVFLIELENFFLLCRWYGDGVKRHILSSMEEGLHILGNEQFPGGQFCMEHLEPGKYMLVCPLDAVPREALPDKAAALRLQLKARLKKETLGLIGQTPDVHVGYAVLAAGRGAGFQGVLYNALCEARRTSRELMDEDKLGLLREFKRVLLTPLIKTVYQPIVDLDKGEVMAWEALSRGPEGSPFHTPDMLFDFAGDMGGLSSLERLCRETALHHFGENKDGRKLFLNVNPGTFGDPGFSAQDTLQALEEKGFSPGDIVFEITERHAIKDLALFHRALDSFRSQGFQVAVDDAGAGYSGLKSIAEIRPDFIKIDMSLIRGIDANPVKRALLETFVAFSEKIGSKIVAEGIETGTELSSLVSMGVHFGQGYYLGMPSCPKEPACKVRPVDFRGLQRVYVESKCSIPIGELCEPTVTVLPDTPVKHVKKAGERNEPLSALVVCGPDNKPRGLVMSHHLDRALSTQYGVSLYYHRSVSKIMDARPLIAETDTPVESVARLAMGRERLKIYDNIVVTENGLLRGTVSVQKMLDTLASIQVEMAKGANPLSGLPGNVAIEQALDKRLEGREPFSIIYCDLDNFKVYNDWYGFKKGDDVILLTSKLLTWASRRHGHRNDFVGHVGGDDFVLITAPDKAERICLAVTRCFGRLVKRHYSGQDLARGGIPGRDRHGKPLRTGFVSVSMAIMDCIGPCTHEAIALRSAEMKTFAKKTKGNSFVRDRRGPLALASHASC